MRILTPAALAATLLCSTTLAQAQGIEFLGRMILAGGLSPAPEASFGRSVSVVTAEDIEERGITQAVEALRAMPGVAVSRAGGPGGQTVIRLRGTEARHVLVLIDGVRVDQAQQGTFYFEGLQAADIERIEVVRGPQSVFFGSNTIGGVVSITTRRAHEPGTRGRTGIEIGSDGTIGIEAGIETRGARGGLAVSGVARTEGGFDISGTPGGDIDGMQNRTLNVAGDWQLTDDWRIGFTARARRQRAEFDPAGPFGGAPVVDGDRHGETREQMASVFGEGDLMDGRLRLTLRASRFVTDNAIFAVGAQTSGDRTRRTELGARAVWALGDATVATAAHTLSFGIDHTIEDYRATFFPPLDPWFDPALLDLRSRANTGLAMEYRGELAPGLELQLGLRRDLNDGFANFTTWTSALSYALPESGTRLRASAGTGVQNPTFLQQFGYAPSSFVGNPALQPEQSRGWDIGIDQSLGGGQTTLSASYFHTRITNAIDYDFTGFPSVTSINLPGVSMRRGVEVSLDSQVTRTLRLRGSYTYTDARSPAGVRLIRRPMHEAGLTLDWQAREATRLSLEARHVAGILDTNFNAWPSVTGPLPDFTLVHLSASHMLTDRLELTGRVYNLFDQGHQEVLGYNGQGRTFYVGIQARF
jgi:vitamin B12 transporter